MRSVAEKLKSPRMLAVPFKFGHALGEPGDADGQRDVLSALLTMLETPGPGPVLWDYVAP